MELVKILSDDSGEQREPELQYWHLVDKGNLRGRATLCSGEFFGYGESACLYETKDVIRGGINCPECLRMIKYYKSIKL